MKILILKEFIFQPDKYEFVSQYSLTESIERLSNKMGNNISGKVNFENVILEKKYKMFHTNSFKPVFYGKFQEQDGKIKLIGAITVSRVIQNVYIIFLSIFLLSSYFNISASFLLVLGIIFVRKVSEFQTKNEKLVIRNTIIEALG